MAKTEEPLTQLATRIPKSLHRELKLHCVHADTSVMDFMVRKRFAAAWRPRVSPSRGGCVLWLTRSGRCRSTAQRRCSRGSETSSSGCCAKPITSSAPSLARVGLERRSRARRSSSCWRSFGGSESSASLSYPCSKNVCRKSPISFPLGLYQNPRTGLFRPSAGYRRRRP